MFAHVGGCVASAGPGWANPGPMLPHLDAMSAHRKHMLSTLGPMLAPKKTTRKNLGKTHGFARFRNHGDGMLADLGGYVGPSWGYVGPASGLCWVVLGLCWFVLDARLSHLGSMLARFAAMLAQHARRNTRRRTKIQTIKQISQKTPKPHATEGSPQVRPRFAPGWSQVDTFSREGVGGRGGEPL